MASQTVSRNMTNSGPLAYRLRSSTTLTGHNGRHLLVCGRPFKVLVISSTAESILKNLSESEFKSIPTLAQSCSTLSKDYLFDFLEDLCARGYLDKQGTHAPTVHPSVSIIIPVRNRAQQISACLQSLQEIDYPRENLEIIVIDDASEDESRKIIEEFPVRLLKVPVRRHASF